MPRNSRRPHSRLFVAAAGVCLVVWVATVVSVARPDPFRPPPPAPSNMARWLWFDRSIRLERWHPAFVVAGSYSGPSETVADHEVFTSAKGLTGTVAALPNRMLLVRTYDFYQFNLWPAAG